uniref:Methylsterol monooxygenase 2-2 n=2 Tax=Ciona intestinalis TaxID=7719 RepID=F6Q7R7_CIOIN
MAGKLARFVAVRKSSNRDQENVLYVLRAGVIILVGVLYWNAAIRQTYIDILWFWLKTKYWYQTVYNETIAVQLYSFVAMVPFRVMNYFKIGTKYKINNAGNYENTPVVDILLEAFEYSWPLVILDTFHVKKYGGVSGALLNRRRQDWIQVTRQLPEDPPLLGDMVRHLVVGLVLYDVAFFLQHFTFHKIPTLYRLFHKKHHTHTSVNVKVTNRLHVIERILLVLSANFGLWIQGAHPLTRSVFIVVFISMLIENHCGFDFPYSYDKILPDGLVGGSRRHCEHHHNGNKNYQPIFTYIDALMDWMKRK